MPQDLKQQNELMAETKLLLEEKVQSVEKKLMDYGNALNSLACQQCQYRIC